MSFARNGSMALLLSALGAGGQAAAQEDVGDPYGVPAEQAPGPEEPGADVFSPGRPGEQEVPPRTAHRPDQPAPLPGQQPRSALPPADSEPWEPELGEGRAWAPPPPLPPPPEEQRRQGQ